MIIKAEKGQTINLGKQGENKARYVAFDLAEWFEEFGTAGQVYLVVKRNGDKQPYIAPVTVDGEKALWTLTNADTANAGSGAVEIQYYLGDVLVKSEIYRTYVADALIDPTEDPPDPYETWLDSMVEVVAKAEAWGNATADAEQVSHDTPASVVIADADGHKVFRFAIPDGAPGERGEKGEDAEVTSESITAALGYTPADNGSVSQMSQTVANLKDFIIRNLPGYGWSAGSVSNVVDYNTKQYIQKVGRVDLGALSYNAWATTVYADAYVENCKAVDNLAVANIACDLYATKSYYDCLTIGQPDTVCVTVNGTVCIRTSQAYSNVTAFRRAVNGTSLYYELATPVVIDLADVI